jgi:hypothetical protein
LYILTFQSNADIPTKKYIFYRRVIQALFSEHDSKSKLGFARERKCNLNQEQFEEILKRFCFISYFYQKYSWDIDYLLSTLFEIKQKLSSIKFENQNFIDDLKLSIALWIEDNGSISFAHRSLQEYFVALYIKELNQDQKKKVYNRIIERSLIDDNLETNNLISLCEEMDLVNYYKYYYIPLLKEINEQIDTSTATTLLYSFLRLLTSYIALGIENAEKDKSKPQFYSLTNIALDENLKRYLYIILPQMQELHHHLFGIVDANRLSLISSNTIKLHVDESLTIDFKKDLPELLFSKIIASKIPIMANQFLTFIQEEIAEATSYIEVSNKNDEDFVGMI